MRHLVASIVIAVLLPACSGLFPPVTSSANGESAASATPSASPSPASSPTPIPTLLPTPAAEFGSLEDQQIALLPEFSADVEVLQGATAYLIQASVLLEEDRLRAQIVGTARIRYSNGTQEQLTDLPLILWPNDDQYRGEASAGPALIDGVLTEGVPELGGLALRYPLPEPLEPGETLDLTVQFQVQAEGPIGGESPHRFGISEGVLFAPTFYPLVPRRLDGTWEVEQAPPGGDTTTSSVAAYWVDLEVPSDLELVATGVEVGREEVGADRVLVHYLSGPARDFAFAVGNLQHDVRTVDDVAVHLWFLASHEDDTARVMEAATFQLELLGELVGPYPYTELDLVDLPGAFGGIEYPGLVTIGTLGGPWIIEPVVHEVAHQWFYGLIGDDQVDEPWLDEAFATYATALYYEHAYGEGRATGYLSDFREIVSDHPEGDRPIGLGVGAYERRSYSVLVYLKGALFYQELRHELGDEAFYRFLRRLFQEYRYGVLKAEQFQAAAEGTCSCELDPLFDRWVYTGGPLRGP